MGSVAYGTGILKSTLRLRLPFTSVQLARAEWGKEIFNAFTLGLKLNYTSLELDGMVQQRKELVRAQTSFIGRGDTPNRNPAN
jgi:hypothetical protein